MKRRIMLLTEQQWQFLRRELVDVGMSSEIQPSETRMVNALTRNLASAPAITRSQWLAYQNAAGEMLEAGADEAHSHIGHSGVRACREFASAINQSFRSA